MFAALVKLLLNVIFGIWLCAHWPVTGSEGTGDGFLISISMPSIANMGSLLFGLM
jgi:hypothetical protein